MTEAADPKTKAEILARMDASWDRLMQYVNACSPESLTGPTDPAGWTAKDHLAHLAAWERSMVYLLQGLPRHEGLGVEEAVYLEGGFDEINAVIQQASSDLPLEDVLALLASVHAQLRGIVEALPESELQQPYSHFLPDEPGRDDDQSPIILRISGNSDHHFDEHLPYIERIVATA